MPVDGPASAPARFDCAAAWDALPPDEQRLLGIAALIMFVAARSPNESAGFIAAQVEASNTIEELVDLRVDPPEDALPDLAPLGVTACRACGCTDQVGCAEGCSWAEPDLCSSCAGATDATARH